MPTCTWLFSARNLLTNEVTNFKFNPHNTLLIILLQFWVLLIIFILYGILIFELIVPENRPIRLKFGTNHFKNF